MSPTAVLVVVRSRILWGGPWVMRMWMFDDEGDGDVGWKVGIGFVGVVLVFVVVLGGLKRSTCLGCAKAQSQNSGV